MSSPPSSPPSSSTSTVEVPPIVDFTLNETITDTSGVVITNQQGTAAAGEQVTATVFDTVDAHDTLDPDIDLNLNQVIESYYDNTQSTETASVLNEIKGYADKIKCSNFKGKGTIEDYNELFLAASKIANETKQMTLDADIEGFNEFASAAEDLSNLFKGFIVKLESISIINDLDFLRAVSSALKKISELADVFGKFKETILMTASIQVPKSTHEARIVVESVMSNVNCAMSYINYFVDPSSVESAPSESDLSSEEKNVIQKAVATIDNWKILCEQDVSVTMSSHPDISTIKQASQTLSSKASTLRNNTTKLAAKLAVYKNI